MTPEQALKILDDVGANFQGNRTQHINIQNALTVFSNLIQERKSSQEAKKTSEEKPNKHVTKD